MANRILRDWTLSENIECLSPHAEVLFTRLIMKADDFGRFHANPKLLKAALFPLKEVNESDILVWLNECYAAGVLNHYQVDGKKYLEIKEFGQRLRTMTSKFPDPCGQTAVICPPIVSNPPPEGRKEVETEGRKQTIEQPIENIDWDMLISKFNSFFNKKTKLINRNDRAKFTARLRDGWTKLDISNAMDSIKSDPFHRESGYKHVTYEYLSRDGTLQRHATKNENTDRRINDSWEAN